MRWGQLFCIRRDERLFSAVVLVVLSCWQGLIISKFFGLFARYDSQTWDVFMRNFHMSGFDPITYLVVTDWHQGFDPMRHPLLAVMFYPLYGLNKVLWMLTGMNCVQLLVGALLLFCAFYSLLFMFRIMVFAIGTRRREGALLCALFFGFAYIWVATLVPDHFCLSLFLLMLTLYAAARKLKCGDRFTLLEASLLFLLTAGVTLSNGFVVVLAVLVVNGRQVLRSWRWLLTGVMLPLLMFILAWGMHVSASRLPLTVDSPVASQLSWVASDCSKADVLVENYFGESLQLHRKHILGDVLTGRPVIVRYSWWPQYVVEAVLVGLFLAGMWCGRRQRFVWLLAAILAFNLLLHVVVGFASNEVYIMACHWAMVIPLSIACLLVSVKRSVRMALCLLLAVITLYLWSYHGVLLWRYLTWPLRV